MSSENSYSVEIQGAEITPTIHIPSAHSTVRRLKELIQARLGVQIPRQILWTPQEVRMEDESTIAEYGSLSAVLLQVKPPPEDATAQVVIFADPDDDVVYEFTVTETETVLELKNEIEERLNVEARDMALWCMDTKMKDHVALSQYYICSGGGRVGLQITNKAGEPIDL